jgi:hypothetical protein
MIVGSDWFNDGFAQSVNLHIGGMGHMAEPTRRFHWYWLLGIEVRICAVVTTLGAILLLYVWLHVSSSVMVIAMPGVVIGIEGGVSTWRDRLHTRLGAEWIDSPIGWKAFWWSLTLIICFALGSVVKLIQ